MANNGIEGLEATLWSTADKLRRHLDAAVSSMRSIASTTPTSPSPETISSPTYPVNAKAPNETNRRRLGELISIYDANTVDLFRIVCINIIWIYKPWVDGSHIFRKLI
jgi:hypothetical protein